MEGYDALVKKLADERSKAVIPNADLPHAKVLIENLVSHAGGVCRVLTGTLNRTVYGSSSVLDAVNDFLQRKGRLEILIEDPPADISEHPLIRNCVNADAECEIRKVVNEEDKKLACHFVVADNNAWRFEPDKRKFAAVACFNDADTANKLVEVFGALFSRGEPMKLAS